MTRLQANLLLALAAMIWGLSFVVQQVGTGSLGAISFTGTRFFLGGLVVAPLALWEYRSIKSRLPQGSHQITAQDLLHMAVIGMVLFSAGCLQQYGIFHTTVTHSGFLTEICVIFVPVIGLLCGHKPHGITWISALLCVFGIWLLSGGEYITIADGDIWVLASSIFWGTHIFILSLVAQRTGAPLLLACVQFLTCGILGILAGIFWEDLSFTLVITGWKGICIMGIFSVGIAFTLQVVGQRYTPAADAAILLSSEALFAALGGALFLHERLSPLQYLGATILFSAVIMVELIPIVQKSKNNCISRE